MHFPLRGDSIANPHLPDTKDFGPFHLVEPSRLLRCTDFSHICVLIITVMASISSWRHANPVYIRVRIITPRFAKFSPGSHDDNKALGGLWNSPSVFMRQMRRMQAAVGTSWDQLGPVRTYQPCVTVDTAIQGISANGSKPGSKVKGKAKCHRSQQAALVGCRAEVDIFEFSKGNRP